MKARWKDCEKSNIVGVAERPSRNRGRFVEHFGFGLAFHREALRLSSYTAATALPLTHLSLERFRWRKNGLHNRSCTIRSIQ